jgi:hypothetical protein
VFLVGREIAHGPEAADVTDVVQRAVIAV